MYKIEGHFVSLQIHCHVIPSADWPELLNDLKAEGMSRVIETERTLGGQSFNEDFVN